MSEVIGLTYLVDIVQNLYGNQTPEVFGTLIGFRIGGPDPLDYVYVYENFGDSSLGVPPHWYYVGFGLSDIYGDNHLHELREPGSPSGFGFELTFRLAKKNNEANPPIWPVQHLQQLSRYVYKSGNKLNAGEHISWGKPMENGRISELLIVNDVQFPDTIVTPFGDIIFLQLVGITSDELRNAQYWCTKGMVELIKTSFGDPWLVTDTSRQKSVMEQDPTAIEKINSEVEKHGSKFRQGNAKCSWEEMKSTSDKSKTEKESNVSESLSKLSIKSDESKDSTSKNPEKKDDSSKTLSGIHLTFNLEAGSLLSLILKGRLKHGHEFIFHSIDTPRGIILYPYSFLSAIENVTAEKPYISNQGWVEVLLNDELVERIINDLEVLSSTPDNQLQLPRTFSWPEDNISITITPNDE